MAGRARGPALPQGRHHRALAQRVSAPRRGRLRALPRRRARHRLERGRRDRRVPARRAHRHGHGDRLARDPAVVARHRGDVRVLVLGVQQHPDRDGSPARAESDHPDLRERRPLRRRRALPRRRREAARPDRLPELHGREQRAAARAADLRRGVARGVGAPPRGHRAVGAHVAGAPAPRRLLEAGLALRRLRGHRVPHDDRRRLGGRISQQLVPHVRAPDLPEAVGLRAVGACRDRHVAARTEPRPDARAHPVVGPLAEGHRQRHRPRTADRAVRAALDPARAGPRHRERRVAVRADLAARTAAARDVVARRRDGEPLRRRPRRARRARRCRMDRVDLLRRRAAVGPARRPAPRRASLPHVHVGAVRAGVRDPRTRAGAGAGRLERAGRLPVGEALRRLPRWHLVARRTQRVEPHPPRLAGAAVADAGRRARRRGNRDRGRLVDVRARSRPTARPRRHRLAQHVVAAAAREAHDRPGRRRRSSCP